MKKSISLITILILFTSSLLPAQQQVSIKTLSLQNVTYNEVNCLAVKFNATLKYSLNNLIQQGDSTSDKYLVELKLKTDKFITAAKGYGTYQNDKGLVRNTYTLLLSNDVREFDNLTIYIPAAALDIPEGSTSLTPVFTITDARKRPIGPDITGEPCNVIMPQKIKLHVTVKDITVAETDERGEFWDYFFGDTEGGKPEVCWSILLAGKKINGSPYAKDSYTYQDPEGKDAVEFTISKNDIFYLNTYDYDMMSFSDLVGSLRIDMNEMERFSGSNFTSRFGKVVKINFTITIL